MKKRLISALVTGAILGVFCIIGVGYRLGYSGNELFLFATWFNRVLMGLVIGLASFKLTKKLNFLFRGVLLGLIVSFAFYVSTSFIDTPGFIAGIVYGIIIDYVATKFEK